MQDALLRDLVRRLLSHEQASRPLVREDVLGELKHPYFMSSVERDGIASHWKKSLIASNREQRRVDRATLMRDFERQLSDDERAKLAVWFDNVDALIKPMGELRNPVEKKFFDLCI